jgi:hypothetical protein
MGFVAKLTASAQKRADPLMPIVGIVMACATALFAALIGSKSLLFLTSEVLLCHALVHILASRFAIAASVVVWPLAFTIFAIATFMLSVSLSNLTTGLAHALASVPGPFFISFVCSIFHFFCLLIYSFVYASFQVSARSSYPHSSARSATTVRVGSCGRVRSCSTHCASLGPRSLRSSFLW